LIRTIGSTGDITAKAPASVGAFFFHSISYFIMTNAVPPPSAVKRVFRVNVQSTETLWILVEAESAEEAKNLAEHIDAEYFHADWANTDWELSDAVLATDYDRDQVAPSEAYGSL
jgi:hypothetical protein